MSDDAAVREFLEESFESLEQVDRDLVELERRPGDRELLDRIFRAIHTIKGTCGFLGFGRLERLAHAGEELLAGLRDGKVRQDPGTGDLLLELVDAVRAILTSLRERGDEGDADHGELVRRLAEARGATPATEGAPSGPATAGGSEVEGRGGEAPRPARVRERPPGGTFVRVDVRVLDRLMDLVGELVLTRNRLLRLAEARRDTPLGSALQRLDQITGQLQEGVMLTRMQPISKVWGRFPRLVRDLAAACGKRVRLQMEGHDTELDRGLIEAVRDPLTHLVRNAVDHGIETPEERRLVGKPEEGRVWIRAYHEAGKVTVEVGDDGRGIDPEAVRRRAVERGLIAPAEAAALPPERVVDMVFLPGFSTAREVTALSGRGVGLDVVRSNVERVGGTIELDSRPGRGTVVRLKIPLTLAILPALIAEAAGHRFALPQASVAELVRLGGTGPRLERVHGAPVLRLRGALLPLVDLREALALPAADRGDGGGTVAVLEAEGRRFGLVLDAVVDTQEIVVKPLGELLERIPVYAGATIMGDGGVALILDVFGLGQRAHVIAEGGERTAPEPEVREPVAAGETAQLLVFRSPDDGRMALPLERVVRLERVPREAVEPVGGEPAIQYRGDILPLVFVFDHLPERRRRRRAEVAESGELHLVVYAHERGTVGLVVGPVVDIVEERIEVRRPSSRDGVRECVVVRGRVTELLDVDRVLGKARPQLLRPRRRRKGGSS